MKHIDTDYEAEHFLNVLRADKGRRQKMVCDAFECRECYDEEVIEWLDVDGQYIEQKCLCQIES